MLLNKSIIKLIIVAVILTITTTNLKAQNPVLLGQDTTQRVINTAVPFLRVAPDARAAGMGDVGVATSPDVNSTYWNPSKLVFLEKDFGFSLSYSPWLRNLVNDMSLSYLSGFYKIDDLQTIGASLRYFNLGSIQFTDNTGGIIRDFTPREMSFDVTYARKLSDNMSVAVSARFIHSNLSADLLVGTNQAETKPGNTGAADISMFYQSDELDFSGFSTQINFGAAITNIGPKISYSNEQERDFIPTNLALGTSITTYIDSYNKFTFALETNKLLVPTPPRIDGQANIVQGRNPRKTNLLSGIFGSFSDAPDGFSEELQEFSLGAGLEYWYLDKMGNELFSARIGYFTEHQNKGNRKYFTVGLGARYNVFGLDVAYLIPQGQNNPLAETLRFSFIFNFDNNKNVR